MGYIDKMNTMSDIAREAGVSRFTVSKVLNGDTSVKESNRQKVLAICARHGYIPNSHAVGLVRGKTNAIAMVVPYITDGLYNEIIELSEHVASSHGYQLIYKSTYNNAQTEAEVIKSFLSMKVCAMIIAPVVLSPDIHIHRLAARRCPVIYLDRPLPGDGFLVANDNIQSAMCMTEYLISRNVRPTYIDSFYRNDNISASRRRQGYEMAMSKHGLAPMFIPNDASDEKQDNEKFGYDNMTSYLRNNQIPEAIFCVTDAVALGAMRAAENAGYTPGKDFLIAGHDHLHFSPYLHPSLTTMRQPKELLSKTCIELADKLVRKQKICRKEYIFPSELIIGQSA